MGFAHKDTAPHAGRTAVAVRYTNRIASCIFARRLRVCGIPVFLCTYVEARKEKKTHVAPVFLIGASCLSFEARCVSGKLKLDAILDGVAPSLLSTVTVVAA
jgi:hypothetical protein